MIGREFIRRWPAACLAVAVSLVSGQAALASEPYDSTTSDRVWNRSPGFYKENGKWYVIFHADSQAQQVAIRIKAPDGTTEDLPLTKIENGKFWWFKGTDADFSYVPQNGDRYRFVVDDETMQDPAARWVDNSGRNAWSRLLLSDAFNWTDDGWRPLPWDKYNIYQVHPLRFTSRNNLATPFDEVIEELDGDGIGDYINNLSVSAIELLPVNEFPGDVSWGYNPAYFYAVEESYGGPQKLKELVNAAHSQGIAVILDVVYNHTDGGGDNILWQVDSDTYFDGDTWWGPLPNFNNDVARHFLVQNLVYLAREYHIDGFRFDSTPSIHDMSADTIKTPGDGGGWNFLREARAKVREVDPRILLIGEEFPDNEGLTAEQLNDSWGGDFHGPMDSQWLARFYYPFMRVLTGEGHLDELRGPLNYYGDSWHDALNYAESHDTAGNHDDRVAQIARDGKGEQMSQIAIATTILARGIPMTFMGLEGAETRQFHIDWWDDRLPLDEYETDTKADKVRRWFREVSETRNADRSAFTNAGIEITHINDNNGVLAFTRAGGKYLIVLNFRGKTWFDYDVGVSGTYKEILNTSWPSFNTSGTTEATRHGSDFIAISDVHIPAYGAVILRRNDTGANNPPKARAGADLTAVAGVPVQLDGSASTDSDGEIKYYRWDIGATGPNPTHTFTQPGTYDVKLTVVDNDMLSDRDTVRVVVEPGGTPANFDHLYFRGTPNQWGRTEMELVEDFTWQVEATFDGNGDTNGPDRFRFSVSEDWSEPYGDDDLDGVTELAGGDIPITEGAGIYRIRFNDMTLAYQVEKLQSLAQPTRFDFNGDGTGDLLWRNPSNGSNALYTMSDGSIQSIRSLPNVSDAWMAFNGDFNGDGTADILWRNGQSGLNWLYTMHDGQVQSSQKINTAGLDWSIAAIGDFTGDGNDDILWRNLSNNSVWLYGMSGAAIVRSASVASVDASWAVAGAGDVNGDGTDDILWRQESTGRNYLYLMIDGALAKGVAINNVSSDWLVAGLADLNGNGRADILWRNSLSGLNWIYGFDSEGALQTSRRLNAIGDTNWFVAALIDGNGDGTDDIVWRHSETGVNYLYLINAYQIEHIGQLNQVSDLAWQVVR